MNFITNLQILTNEKYESYDFILIIINYLKKMAYYKLIKIIINISDLAEIMIDIVVYCNLSLS